MHKFQLLSYKTKLLLLEFELLCYHILLIHLNKVHFVLYLYIKTILVNLYRRIIYNSHQFLIIPLCSRGPYIMF